MSFDCKVCNKKYKSYQSLWNHNKKFHVNPINTVIQSNPIVIQSNPDVIQKFNCKYCKNAYSNRQNKWKHEQKCKHKKDENEQKQIELELKKKDAEILQLKLKLQKQVDYVTFKKLNKMLVKHNNSVTNVQNINITNNNFQIMEFDKNISKEILETLTLNEKRIIIGSKRNCFSKQVEIVHCGRYDKFKSFIITNSKENYINLFNKNLKYFILSEKNVVMKNIVDNHINILESIFSEIQKYKDYKIERFINRKDETIISSRWVKDDMYDNSRTITNLDRNSEYFKKNYGGNIIRRNSIIVSFNNNDEDYENENDSGDIMIDDDIESDEDDDNAIICTINPYLIKYTAIPDNFRIPEEDFYIELEPVISNLSKKAVTSFISDIKNNNKKYICEQEGDDVEYENFRHYQTSVLNKLIFNHQEKITSDLSKKYDNTQNHIIVST